MNRLVLLTTSLMTIGVLVLAVEINRAWGRRVNAGDHWVRMLVQGTYRPGNPTVVLESGLGGPLESWVKVQPKIARFTRVVSYDRANTMGSMVCAGPHDALHVANDLHTALRNAGIDPPYVLVGHSLGGLFVRVYAHRYPAEVAGLVLIEPSQEQTFDFRKFHVGENDRESDSELVWLPDTLSQARDSDPLPSIPVSVVTGARDIDDPKSPAFRPDILAAREKWIRSIQGGRHILARNSYHLPQDTEPNLIVSVIRDVVELARHSPVN